MTASTPQPPIDTKAILHRAEQATLMCGPCDGGLPMSCTCDPEPRAVIADLLAHLAAVTTERDEAVAMAWDEGFDAGERDVLEHESSGEWAHECIPNPYRAALDSAATTSERDNT